jgi:polysaccharide export outer membrane protein
MRIPQKGDLMKVIKNPFFNMKSVKLVTFLSLAIFILGQFNGGLRAQDEKAAKQTDQQTQKTKKDQVQAVAVEPPYMIGNTDRLSVTFWQQPDLNRDVRVGEDGTISLPVIGEIKAAGMTTSELAKKIIQQMSIYNTPVSQATVTVLEFNSRSIVVTGQVQIPGTLRYEKMPDVWTAILDAGGPLPDADLARVSIVRRGGGKSDVINVNLYNIIKDGDLSKAPQLTAGDLVNVPLSTFGTPLELTTSYAAPTGKNIFYIFGQVNEQGPRNLDQGMDVLDAIAVARGYTPEADLKNVRVIIKDKRFSSVVKVNLEEYTRSGRPARMLLHPEDTIIVPARRTGIFRSTISTLASIVPILGAVGTVILLVERR